MLEPPRDAVAGTGGHSRRARIRRRRHAARRSTRRSRRCARRCHTPRRRQSRSATGAIRSLIRCAAAASSCRASNDQPAARGNLGHVEVAAAARPEDHVLLRGVSGRRPRSAAARRTAMTSSSNSRATALSELHAHHRRAALHAPVSLDPPEPAVRGRPPPARCGDRRAPRARSRLVRDRQRLPRRSASPTASPTVARRPQRAAAIRRQRVHET